jgi:hypothetical protein
MHFTFSHPGAKFIYGAGVQFNKSIALRYYYARAGYWPSPV